MCPITPSPPGCCCTYRIPGQWSQRPQQSQRPLVWSCLSLCPLSRSLRSPTCTWQTEPRQSREDWRLDRALPPRGIPGARSSSFLPPSSSSVGLPLAEDPPARPAASHSLTPSQVTRLPVCLCCYVYIPPSSASPSLPPHTRRRFIFPSHPRPRTGSSLPLLGSGNQPPYLAPLCLCCCSISSGMPSYCLQDCHYFYRTALRGLNISTHVSPLYA